MRKTGRVERGIGIQLATPSGEATGYCPQVYQAPRCLAAVDRSFAELECYGMLGIPPRQDNEGR
jgi:hypothetical protein